MGLSCSAFSYISTLGQLLYHPWGKSLSLQTRRLYPDERGISLVFPSSVFCPLMTGTCSARIPRCLFLTSDTCGVFFGQRWGDNEGFLSVGAPAAGLANHHHLCPPPPIPKTTAFLFIAISSSPYQCPDIQTACYVPICVVGVGADALSCVDCVSHIYPSSPVDRGGMRESTPPARLHQRKYGTILD